MNIMVIHPGQQHSYHMAESIKRMGKLKKYGTTVYNKRNSLTRVVTYILKGNLKQRAQLRRTDELLDSEVVQFEELYGLIQLFTIHKINNNKIRRFVDYSIVEKFATKAYKYIKNNQVDAVISYDYNSRTLFKKLKDNLPGIIRILDVSAVNRVYMAKIYEKDYKLAEPFSIKLQYEVGELLDSKRLSYFEEENQLSDFFIVPSTFVKESLEYSGIDQNRIFVCPYGVDLKIFSQKKYDTVEKMSQRPIEFIYVGGVKELKGIYYLLECFLQIPVQQARLTVVGDIYDEKLIEKYKDRINFVGRVPHDEIPNFLKKSDVFVFPSLGDSFAFSVLEAAACGLPLIVSENTGMKDGVTEECGFIISIQDIEAIRDKVLWFCGNRDKIREMGEHARKMSEQFTWINYDNKVKNAINEIIKMGDADGKQKMYK